MTRGIPPKSAEYHRERLYDRLVARVAKNELTGCWNWRGPSWHKRKYAGNRYGFISVMQGNGRTRTYGVHRAMWIALHGPLTAAQHVCHKCDNPLCCNPDHLFLGDAKINAVDASEKKRRLHQRKTHCPKGHDYAVHGRQFVGSNGRIWRACELCQQARGRLRAGWPEELAWRLPSQRKGRRPNGAAIGTNWTKHRRAAA